MLDRWKEGVGTESFAALIFCGKRILLWKKGRETMRQAVANDGLRVEARGRRERRGLRERECPLTGKLISSFHGGGGLEGGEKDCHLHIINGRVPWQQATGDIKCARAEGISATR